ncbi:MAG: hypothetical protein KF760_18205 [Candidatus Eremiobacteraeota bacterium]|nr:hypothetical protein [Candidatus Eremiobacteraeota bacterium]MCW5866729.1 hypothetical protein [Candidatus Eremiobacteraeota bacterium]
MTPRGFLLPLALLIAMFFGIIGGAFLYSQSILYRGTVGANLLLQARSLAEVGVEDARCKLQRDIDFPPAGSEEQTEYAYAETYMDPITRVRAGSYTVVLDQTHAKAPYFVLVVRSTGSASNGDIDVIKTIVAELDVSPKDRDDPTKDNPHYLQVLNWQEK